MRSALTYSSVFRTNLSWLLLSIALLLSGCKSYGPMGAPNFDPAYSRTLEKSEQLQFSARTELVEGTYMEAEEVSYPSYEGVILLTNERVLFATWNEKQQRYEPSIWMGYDDIVLTKMHDNNLMQYIAIIANDGSKFTFMLNQNSVEPANAILLEHIQKFHKTPMPASQMPESHMPAGEM